MTYSIVARDPATGDVGVAVQSKFPGVASLICHGAAGVGVVATQAFSNPEHGTRGLELLRLGVKPRQVIDILLQDDASAGERQVAIMNTEGLSAQHTGADVMSWQGAAGAATGRECLAHGNSLASLNVVDAMVRSCEKAQGEFAQRLIGSLQAGQDAGGELRGVQAAGVLVFRPGGGYGQSQGRHVDISVYDHPDPIGELARCYRLHRLSYFESDPASLKKITPDIAAALEGLLVRQGYLDSKSAGGGWSQAHVKAMARFMGTENYDNRIRDDDLIDLEVLDDIRSRYDLG